MEGNCRITVLNERLLRVEYNERGRFLDSPSFAFISRATRSEPRICTIGRSGALGTAPDITESALGSERHAKDDLIVLAESHQLRLCLDTRSGYLLAMTQQCRKTVLEYVDSGAVDAAETAAASKNDPPRMKYRTVRDPQNQGGTIQTLDECDGWYHIRKLVDIRQNGIGEGFFSADGLAIINDSNSLVFMGKNWSDPLDEQGFVTRAAFFGGSHDHLDLVLFEHSPKGPEQSFPEILREYLFPYIGAPPKPPLEVFGVWFCRYWPYRQQDIIDLVLRFENRSEPESAPHRGQANASQPCRLPAVDLSIFVIDMDWHQPDQWTGFSWNRALFPDPEALMAWLHSRPCPVRVALNLHPADGIAPNEDMFLQARALAYPEHNETEHIPFHIMDCRFRQAYFSVVLNALENQIAANEMRMIKHGVDFWWVDWQQGVSKRDGFDPMPLLNHYHYLWAANGSRNGRLLPVILSRWPGLGGHRYPVGFSGDTLATWDSLAMQPAFTAMAANVGFYYWSHDIGGHYGGYEDPELYVRWLQWGCFSPILRLHCSKNPFMSRTPWAFGSFEIEAIARKILSLRASLALFFASIPAHIPICAPMYHFSWSEAPERRSWTPPAFDSWTNQYYLGGNTVIVAPFLSPREASTQLSSVSVCLPPHRQWIAWDEGIATMHPCTDLDGIALDDSAVWNTALPTDTCFRRFGELSSLNVFLGEGAIVLRLIRTNNEAILKVTIVTGRQNTLEVPHLALRIEIGGVHGDVVSVERLQAECPSSWYRPRPIRRLRLVLRKPNHTTMLHDFTAEDLWGRPSAALSLTWAAASRASSHAQATAHSVVKLFLHHFRLRSDQKEHLFQRYLETTCKAGDAADFERYLDEFAMVLSAAQREALLAAHLHGWMAFAAPFVGEVFTS
jgi:hypothetical protein